MDSTRFGRVLGIGARHAAKTLISAVDAATSPAPSSAGRAAGRSAGAPPSSGPNTALPRGSEPEILPPARSRPAPVPAASVPPQRQSDANSALGNRTASAAPSRATPSAVAGTPRGLAEGSRRFGRALWGPAVRLSGVLWLELTGVFFGLFALVAAIAIWRLRTSFRQPGAGHTQFLMAVGMTVVFGYFCISSFMSASRRSRRR